VASPGNSGCKPHQGAVAAAPWPPVEGNRFPLPCPERLPWRSYCSWQSN